MRKYLSALVFGTLCAFTAMAFGATDYSKPVDSSSTGDTTAPLVKKTTPKKVSPKNPVRTTTARPAKKRTASKSTIQTAKKSEEAKKVIAPTTTAQ